MSLIQLVVAAHNAMHGSDYVAAQSLLRQAWVLSVNEEEDVYVGRAYDRYFRETEEV